jgi:flagellar hook-associated protein 2
MRLTYNDWQHGKQLTEIIMERRRCMVPVYNYILESYPVKREVMYPAHKRSELRRVYNSIVNQSRRSPLYKINLSKDNQAYTFGIKETAIELKTKLSRMEDPVAAGFSSKSVYVSDEKVLFAKLLKEDTEGLPEDMTFRVNSLASVQINSGKELLLVSKGLAPGNYEFNARIMDQHYKLNYIHENRVENSEALRRMAEFVNMAIPGVNATVEKGSNDEYGRIVIISEQAGRNGEPAFQLSDSIYDRMIGVVEYFGMDRVEKSSRTAEFTINDITRQTTTNTFNLEGKLRINLNGTSEEPVSIKIVPDSEKILSSLEQVLDVYNRLIHLAQKRTQEYKEHYRASKLISEMKGLEKIYAEELEACGIMADENGYLNLKDSLAVQAAIDGGIESLFTRENGFIARLKDKAESITINPMEYLEKTIVTYPDRDHKTFRNPYVTSMYSGLFFSSYC